MSKNIKIKKDKKEKTERIRARKWLLTLNNPTITLKQIHELTGAQYTTGQLEQGEQGTVHLQFMQHFNEQKTLTFYKKYLKEAHAQPIKKDNGVQDYVNKEETRIEGPWTYGEPLLNRNSKQDWEEVYLKAKRGLIEEIPADIRVRCYSNLKKIEKDHLEIKDSDGLRGIWIYGESGFGKSRMARRDYPNAYPKLCNKWWDGYKGQEYVIMDDIGLEHKVLGQQLKIWTDRYGIILENKGGAMTDRYKKFIVTSQYSIEQIWEGDKETIQALKRRFNVIHLAFKLDFDYNGNDSEVEIKENIDLALKEDLKKEIPKVEIDLVDDYLELLAEEDLYS